MDRVFSSQIKFTYNHSIKEKTPWMRWGLLILGGLFYIKVYYRHQMDFLKNFPDH